MIKHGTWRLQELHIMRDETETDEEDLMVNHSDLDADLMPESCKADFLEHLKSVSSHNAILCNACKDDKRLCTQGLRKLSQ
jgi:hypothetical protein